MTKQYYAIQVQATLKVLSPLLIASGDHTLIVESEPEQQVKGNESRNTLQPCKTADGSYYLPASSLKGACYAFSQQCDKSQELSWIFGETARQQGEITTSRGGLVRFYNAFAKSNIATEKITRNSIDAITGAAKQGHLFDVETINPGSEFICRLSIDEADLQQLQSLKGLLLAWGRGENSLGRHSRNEQGQFELCNIEIFAIEESRYRDWLKQPEPDELAKVRQKLEFTCNPLESNSNALTLKLKLIPLSPIFISDGKQHESDNNHQIARSMKNSANQYILPSTSVRGSYRALGRKILLTQLQKHGEQAEAKADELLQVLFGGETHASSLTISDFVAQNHESVEQAFIAIDRFTGGVKGGTQSKETAGGNYLIEKPIVNDYLGRIRLNHTLMEQKHHAQLAIFLLVLRDLMQGEMLFGGLKGKGFGKARAEVQWVEAKEQTADSDCWLSDWDALQEKWQEQKLPCFTTLNEALMTLLDNQRTPSPNSGEQPNHVSSKEAQ
ncbi:RAMP superfamily CRISPR-associated protein [Vibrio injensis]|uniref:RAMP superfamily CRISPR-associated protein n=1 Tax=Vibrio injensis TaxID=1307414 RepID=UPI000934ADA0|nr:RAMP superfamily CRISPR-associated protein [Vibrio injensis]